MSHCTESLDTASAFYALPSSLCLAVSLEDLITDLLSNPVDVEDWVS